MILRRELRLWRLLACLGGTLALLSCSSNPASPSTVTLTISVVGLPAGAIARASVSGPGGYALPITDSRSVSGLPAGTFTVIATDVAVGAATYSPLVARQTVTLAAGESSRVDVSYVVVAAPQPSIGELDLTVVGLPDSTPASIVLIGPDNEPRQLVASQQLPGLAAGAWTVVAAAISAGNFTYAPGVATRAIDVPVGGLAQDTIVYSAIDGVLAIEVAGTPDGSSPSFTITGPNGFAQTTIAGVTPLTRLAPGTYTVTASSVASNGSTYGPSPATQAIAVPAGATASANVVYSLVAPTTGGLTVTITGSPVNASVTVTGPGGYSHAVPATQTLSGLVVGSYTVTAASVTANGFTYAGAPPAQTVSVTAGATAAASVTYGATTGALAVTVTGAPASGGSVRVTGPGGYSQALTATQTLSGLVPGSYTLAAASVTSGSTTYTPQSASQGVSVAAGGTTAATVTYTAASGLPTLAPGYYPGTVTISAAQAGGTTQTYGYQIYIPTGYTPNTAWPIILTSSGSGEFGTDNTAQLGVGLGPHVAALGERAIVVFPQWHSSPSVPGLRSLMEVTALRQTLAEVHADSTRLYATGNSSGGFQVWETLYRYPTLFAAGVSAAGGINASAQGSGAPSVAAEVDALLPIPMWIFSSDDDTTVPTATYFTPIVTEWALRGAGPPAHQATLYHAIGGHQATWDTAFAAPATWTWLFAQHR